MAFFEDLTPYTYFPLPEERASTVNIGWLGLDEPFNVGVTSAEFRVKLGEICKHRVMQTRGFHRCDFCKSEDKPHGSAEIRVESGDRVYAAPELMHHYVVVHNYKPPDEFIHAVMASI